MSITERDKLHAETLAEQAVQQVKAGGGTLNMETVMQAFLTLARTPEYDADLLRALEYDPDDGTAWAECAGHRLTLLLADAEPVASRVTVSPEAWKMIQDEETAPEPLAPHMTTEDAVEMEPKPDPPKPHRRRSR